MSSTWNGVARVHARPRLLLILVLIGSVARPLSGEEPKGSPRVVEEFDVDTSGDPLVVPITLGGKSEWFIVDTGCSHVAYDRSLQRHLGRYLGTTDCPTLFGGARLEWFEAPAAYLGALDLRGALPENAAPVLCVDLGALRAAMGEDVRGIIGCSFLRRHVVRLDPDRGKLSFLDRATVDAGVRVPFTFGDGETPLVRVELPGVGPKLFVIDSGCTPSGGLDEATTTELRRQSVLTPVGTPPAVTFGSEAPRASPSWQIPFLTLAGFRHCDLVFSELWEGGAARLALDICFGTL